MKLHYVFTIVLLFSVPLFLFSDQQEILYSELQSGQYLILDPDTNLEEIQENEEEDNLKSGFDPNLFRGSCINGLNPANLTPQELLSEFNQGNCSPVILVPGFLATGLRVEIECQRLKSDHPRVFKGCGWRTCSFYRAPQKQYRIWVSSNLSPMRTTQYQRSSTCLGDLLYLNRNQTQPNYMERYSSPSGIKISYFGNTPETKSDNKCGANAIQYISSKSQQSQQKASCALRGWGPLIDTLEAMGYQSGVTYQAIPYDWRLDLVASETQITIPQSIKTLYSNTQKKVVVFAHSLGTVHALYSLTYKLTQAQKDQMIATYVPIGPVFLGAPSGFRTSIGGDRDMIKDIWRSFRVGIQFYSQRLLLQMPSAFDMYPKDTFERFENTTWLSLIQKRIQYEQNPDSFAVQDIPLDYFPRTSPDVDCGQYETRPIGRCITGIDDWTKQHFIKIVNKTFNGTMSDILETFEYSINGQVLEDIFNESLNAQIDDLVNPGVPTILYYTNLRNTDRDYEYSVNPQQIVEESESFYFPEVIHQAAGDGTVLSTSSLVPGIQWAWEFENVKGNSKPLRFLELCSGQKLVNDIYDTKMNGFKTFSKNGYNGLQCSCQSGKDTISCGHSCLINEPNFLNFAAKLVQTYDRSNTEQFENQKANQGLSTSEILKMQEQCSNLNKN